MPSALLPRVCWLLLCTLLALPLTGQTDTNPKKTISLVTGPETSDLLESLGEPLLQAAKIKPDDVHFHVMLDSTLNAVALPGQNIIFNSGLILAVHDRDELAAVMAHEIAHLSSGHHIQLETTMKDAALRTMVAFIAGVAAGALTGNDQLTQATIMGGVASSQSSLLETIREKEIQADRLAIHYLLASGFDPQGMVHFMERLNREQQLNNMPPPYMLTHPLSSNRITESQQQIAALTTTPTANRKGPLLTPPSKTRQRQEADNTLLARVQAVLEAGTTNDLNGVMTRLRKRLETDPDHFPTRYGLALTERYMGQLQAAITNLEMLLAKQAHDPYLLRERGLVRLELGKPTEAEADFRDALHYQPQRTNADLRYRLAFALHEQEKLLDASHILRQLTLEHPFVAEYFYLLGVVEGKQQHLGASHLALARHFHLTGEEETARWHYREAIRQFAVTDTGRDIAQDELRRLNPQNEWKKLRRR